MDMDIKDDFIDPFTNIEQKMNKEFKNSLKDFAILSEENQHPRNEPKEQPERQGKENGTYISKVYCSSYNNVDGQPHQECYQAQSIKQVNEGHNISEAREAYKNSDGVMKSAYQRGLDEKGARFIKEKNSKLKKFTTTPKESINKRDIVPTKTSQSMNTESYEYFNQKTSSKYNITESPSNIINQQSNYRYSSNNQNSNSNYMSKNRVMQDAQNIQGVMNLPGLKCTCNQINQNLQQNFLKCTCSDKKEPVCTCGEFKKQLFEEKKISGNNSTRSGKA